MASTCRIRRVEERVAEIYPTDKIRSPVHLSIGQEAVSVGACDMLQSEDVVFGTYRGHAMYLARGGDLKQMIAELYGKSLRQRAEALEGGPYGMEALNVLRIEKGFITHADPIGKLGPWHDWRCANEVFRSYAFHIHTLCSTMFGNEKKISGQ